MEKMDNKTIQKLRELYFKVCTRLFATKQFSSLHTSPFKTLRSRCWNYDAKETTITPEVQGRSPHATIVNKRNLVGKRGKDLCFMFLLAILGVDPAQNVTKSKRWLCVLITTLRLCNSCIINGSWERPI